MGRSADVEISNFGILVHFCELRVGAMDGDGKNQNGTASTRPSPSWWDENQGAREVVAKAPREFFGGLTFGWAAFDGEKATARGRKSADRRTLRNQISKF